MSPRFYILLADAVLTAHAALAAFVALGLPVVWIGAWRGWAFARNPWLRAVHLGLLGCIALEALVGVYCPLTVWEDALRQLADQPGYQGSCVEYWVSRILFHPWPPAAFTVLYILYFALTAITWRIVRPRPFGFGAVARRR
ncbi:MAG: DUF2784 domain-containing protein [bacterium]|nr:DUF2784 domain-containing protein [bacterium]